MKPTLWIAALLTLLASPVAAVDLAGIEAATFILYANGNSTCSGQVVQSGEGGTLLLTAHHCLGDSADTEFSIRTTVKVGRDIVSYTSYSAVVIKKDPKQDLAVLRLRDEKVTLPVTDLATAEEADTALFKGADVLAAGYPATWATGMEDLVFSDGLFTGVRESFVPSISVDVYRSTVPVWYGKSGGGLYAQIDGKFKLVGVATQLDPETPWETSLWVPVAEVHKMLKGTWIDGKNLSDPAYTER